LDQFWQDWSNSFCIHESNTPSLHTAPSPVEVSIDS
jgi:hypothetical protein